MNPVPFTVLVFLGITLIVGISSWIHSSPFSSPEPAAHPQSSSRVVAPPLNAVQWINEPPRVALPAAPPAVTPVLPRVPSLPSLTPVPLPALPSVATPKISESDLNSYYLSLMNVFRAHSFTNEEFLGLQKNTDGRFFTLEELAARAAGGTSVSALSTSFDAWEGLDARVLSDLQALSAPASLQSFHATLVAWFAYHKSTAGMLSDPSLTSPAASLIFDAYLQKARASAPKFSELRATKSSFSFIPTAQAFAGIPSASAPRAFFHFGGKVETINEVCVSGLNFKVGDPVGGDLFVYTAVLAANPFMYKLFTPGVWVLGKSIPVPGVCTNIGIDAHFSGQATVLFWGSSKL